MRTLALSLLALLVGLLLPPRADAQETKTIETWRATAQSVVALRTTVKKTNDGGFSATVAVQPLDAKLADDGKPIVVHDGGLVFPSLAVRPGAAAVVLLQRAATPKVKLALVDLATAKTKTIDLPRTAQKGFVPTTSIACDDGEGFTIVWQEQNPMSPNDVQSTMARVKADGTVLAKPTTVGIPWGLGAIVSTGSGYLLAVRYDGAKPDQTRICFVTLSADGTPQEHPWWGARPELVGEIQLVEIAGKVTAVYRAESADAILSVAVDKSTGSWGKEADASKTLAKNVDATPFAARAKDGAVQLVRR